VIVVDSPILLKQPPLYRSKHAARFTQWIQTESRDISRHSYGSRLRLLDSPDDACVSWRINLKQATEQKDTIPFSAPILPRHPGLPESPSGQLP